MTLKTYGNDAFLFDLEVTLDWWIVGLLGVGYFFTSVPPDFERKMLDGVGWCWDGRGR